MINLPARLRKKKKNDYALENMQKDETTLEWISVDSPKDHKSFALSMPFYQGLVLFFFSLSLFFSIINPRFRISFFFPSFSLRLRSTRGQIWGQRRNDKEERSPTKRDLKGGFDRLDTDGAVLMQTAKLRGDYPIRSSD